MAVNQGIIFFILDFQLLTNFSILADWCRFLSYGIKREDSDPDLSKTSLAPESLKGSGTTIVHSSVFICTYLCIWLSPVLSLLSGCLNIIICLHMYLCIWLSPLLSTLWLSRYYTLVIWQPAGHLLTQTERESGLNSIQHPALLPHPIKRWEARRSLLLGTFSIFLLYLMFL
jgi:hypothetical protein